MAGKDNFFKARMTDEQVQTLENIVKEIQADTPEANVTASSIARYALEKYVEDYRAKKDGRRIIIDIGVAHEQPEDLLRLFKIFSEFKDKVCAEENENIGYITTMILHGIMGIMPKALEKKYGKRDG